MLNVWPAYVARFAPEIKFICYIGGKEERIELRQKIKSKSRISIILTTYEVCDLWIHLSVLWQLQIAVSTILNISMIICVSSSMMFLKTLMLSMFLEILGIYVLYMCSDFFHSASHQEFQMYVQLNLLNVQIMCKWKHVLIISALENCSILKSSLQEDVRSM